MNLKSFLVFGLFLVLALNFISAPDVSDIEPLSKVSSIYLAGEEDEIEWDVVGYSPQGFKVVWSKNENPEYPLRTQDKYLYFTDPKEDEAELEAFDGPGIYYVRVCEYLGGKCGIYSNQIKLGLGIDDDDDEVEEEKEEVKKDSENPIPTLYDAPVCDGCFIDDKCVPVCYRKAGVYCALGGELINQSLEGAACDNNCECESNVCAGGECVSAGMIQKVLNWFKKFFG